MIDTPPDGEEIVAMVEHQGTIYLATRQHVYRLEEDGFDSVMFVSQPEGMMGAVKDLD